MLIVMKNRNIQDFLQAFFDFKASGSTDILQIDPAEAGSKIGDSLDDLLCVLGIQTNGNCVDPTEFFKENSFPFHNRHSRIGTDISKTENSASVGNNCHCVCLHGILVSRLLILRNYLTRFCHTGRVGK